MKSKLVSIILPTYNGERFLKDSIESVLSQTYTNWELIIVNDCSKDNTLLIAKEYEQKDNRIRVISNKKNLKLPASLNVGFKEAKGEYYTWTSDDNMFKPKAIEYMVQYLENNPEIDLLSCNFDYIEEDCSFQRHFADGWDRQTLQLAKGCNIGACFMYTKNIAQKVGEYNENMFCAEDYEYWCRIAIAGSIKYLDENLYLYRNNSQSLTATRQETIQKRSMEIRLKYADKIMDNINLSSDEKINQYLNFYREEGKIIWLQRAIMLNPYKFCRNLINNKYNRLKTDLRIYKILNNKKDKICLWGASLFLEDFIKKYHIKNENILGIVDKNENRHGEKIGKYTIYSPEKLNELKPDIVICTIKNKHEHIYPKILKELQIQYPNIKLEADIFD